MANSQSVLKTTAKEIKIQLEIKKHEMAGEMTVAKGICCSYRGREFRTQHPYGGSQGSVASAPGV